MAYGELARFPIDIVITLRMEMFCNSLIDNSGKLSSILYKLMLKIHESSQADVKWIKYIKSIVDEIGLSYFTRVDKNWSNKRIK
jgi:hypothetical protein